MRPKRQHLIRISYAAAWLALGVILVCFVLDRSGWIADSIRGRANRSIEGLDVEVGDVSILWFRPGIVLDTATITSGDGFVAFDSVEVRFSPLTALFGGGFVDEVEIDGGRARISDELLRGVQSALTAIRERGSDEPSEPREGGIDFPTASLTDFRVDLDIPGEGILPIGRVDLLVESSEGDARVAGRLLPDLAGSEPEAALHIAGRALRSGQIEVEASATELPIDGARIPEGIVAIPDELRTASAVLAVALQGSFDLGAEESPRVAGQLSLRDGRVEVSGQPIEDARARIDVTWEPGIEGGLWSEKSWDGAARIDASWRDTAIEVSGRLGRSANDAILSAWARVPEVSIDRERLISLELGPHLDEYATALSPSGSVEVSVGACLTRILVGESPAPAFDVVVDVRPLEDAIVRYVGFRETSTGDRNGVPIPASDIEGRVVVGFAPLRERAFRMGLVELAGKTDGGSARYDGAFVGPRGDGSPDDRMDYDMELFVPELAIDEQLREGLSHMSYTRGIWDEYGPDGGGTVSSRWHFQGSQAVRGFTAQGDIEFEVGSARWADLPVPVRNARGRVALRWANRPNRIEGYEKPRNWRAMGAHVEATGEVSNGGRAMVDIRFRNESPEEDVIPSDRIPAGGAHSELVTVDRMSLRGSDFETLVATHPIIGDVAATLGLKGRAGVTFRGGSRGPGAPYRLDLEITPEQLELRPESFPIPIRDARGRAIVTGVQRDLAASEGLDFSLRGTLAARAAAGFTLVGVPTLADEVLRLEIAAAGIDPENRSVLGAFETSLGVGGDLDPGRVSLRGHVDAGIDITIAPEAEPAISAEMNLRRNSLVAGELRLDEMDGAMRLEERVLYGDRVEALLATTGVTLSDLVLAGAGEVPELEDPDPILAEPGFLVAEDGVVIQARLEASNLPLDEAHLSPFLDAETVATLLDKAALRGFLDVEGTRLVVVPDGRGNLKLALAGVVVPNNTSVQAGLPIKISSGTIDIERLVIEPSGTRAWAHVDDLFGAVAGRKLERASMLVSLVESRLAFENLDGVLEGGQVTSLGGDAGGSALAVDLVEPHFFTAALQMKDVDANGLLRGLFDTSISDKGLVQGWMRMWGEPDDLLAVRGEGNLKLTDARLWSIPVLRALFGQLGFDGTGTFDEMETRLRLDDGVLYMDNMDARSPILHLVGEGSVDFDGRLHHDLEVQYSVFDRLGPFKTLIYWIQNSILRVAIRGTMWRPNIVLRNVVKDVFVGEPQHERSLPLPGLSPIPARF